MSINALKSLAWLTCAALLVFATACSDPDSPGEVVPDNPDVPCATSDECDGGICLLEICRECADDSACASDPAYGDGATCVDGACEPCTGALDCACDNGSCDGDLQCEDDVCVECTQGADGCPCFGNDTCLEGLRCADDACETCPPGDEGCVCGEENACGDGLICMADLCVTDPCTLGVDGCPCREDGGDDPRCDEGLVCTDGDMCAECTNEFEGCACEDDACGDGLRCNDDDFCEICPPGEEDCACLEENGDDPRCEEGLVCDGDEETCRGPLGCVDLGCVDNQLCEESEGGIDALCLEECAEGFEFNADNGTCDEIQEVFPNCDADTEGSILADCTADNRVCVADEENNTAECGGCLDFFLIEDDACRAVVTCADLTCADENRDCTVQTETSDAECADCLLGFEEVEDLCQPLPEANCQTDDPDSILADCNDQNRVCVEDGNTARCEGCRDGFAEDEQTLLCIRRLCIDLDPTCESLGRECIGEPLAECGDCLEGLAPADPEDPLSQCNEPIDCSQRELGIFTEAEPNNGPVDATNLSEIINRIDAALAPSDQDWYGVVTAENNTELSFIITRKGVSLSTRAFLCDESEPNNCTFGSDVALDGVDSLGAESVTLTFNFPTAGRYFLVIEGSSPADEGGYNVVIDDGDASNDLACDPAQFCVDQDGGDSLCTDWPCLGPDNNPDFQQAFGGIGGDTCVDCINRCGPEGSGETGRLWPFTLENSNQCICETEPGFYYDLLELDAEPCDADADGWIRSTAKSAIKSSDESLRENARCGLRTVDRVVLENEFRQTFTVKICEEGMVGQTVCDPLNGDADCSEGSRCNPQSELCDCTLSRVLDLFETKRNDDQPTLDLENENNAPTYEAGGRGRVLRASELTPLTKACVSTTGDHNDNGVRDIIEWQGDAPDDTLPDTIAFMEFAYFVELHESRFERTLGQELGRLHISEKPRCSDDFPVQYNTNIDQGDYWQSCTRNRDADFDSTGNNLLIGHEFAAWSCPQGALSCPMPPPPTDLSPSGTIPAHGLCDDNLTLPPIDGVWRGMNHASQFKCVNVVDTIDDQIDRQAEAPHLLLRTGDEIADIEGNGLYQVNQCGVNCPSRPDPQQNPRTFANIGDMTLNGDAVQDGAELMMTPNLTNQVGTAFLTEPFDLSASNSFSTFFEVSLGPNINGGTGAIFMVQNNEQGAEALGDDAFRLGYNGIDNSVGVEFDTTDNGDGANEPNGNHVAISVAGNISSPIAIATPAFDLNESTNFVWIDHDDLTDTMSVYISQSPFKPDDPLLTTTVDLSTEVGDQGFFGFGAGNGSNFNRHAIARWGLAVGPLLDEPDDLDCQNDCNGDACELSSTVVDGDNDLPNIVCSPVAREDLQTGAVGFAAVRFVRSPGLYVRGCIDEFNPDVNLEQAEPWKSLCPGYIENPRNVVGQGNPGNFGELICGCGLNFGGINCDIGCPETVIGGEVVNAYVHYGGDEEDCADNNGYCVVSDEGRKGFWMCGSFSTVSYEDAPTLDHSDGWSMTGEIPVDGVSRDKLCETDDCDTGFNVH